MSLRYGGRNRVADQPPIRAMPVSVRLIEPIGPDPPVFEHANCLSHRVAGGLDRVAVAPGCLQKQQRALLKHRSHEWRSARNPAQARPRAMCVLLHLCVGNCVAAFFTLPSELVHKPNPLQDAPTVAAVGMLNPR